MQKKITYRDFKDIVQYAKLEYAKTTLPMRVSNHEVNHNDVSHILIIESFLRYMVSRELLNQDIEFDY